MLETVLAVCFVKFTLVIIYIYREGGKAKDPPISFLESLHFYCNFSRFWFLLKNCFFNPPSCERSSIVNNATKDTVALTF